VPKFVTEIIDKYVSKHREVLTRGRSEQNGLWISSTRGEQLTVKNLGTLISKLTLETIGVDVSPHLFRSAGASTAAIYGSKNLHLASALLAHRDKRIVEQHYNYATGLDVSIKYAKLVREYYT
jgi:site-specific recombinase XerD